MYYEIKLKVAKQNAKGEMKEVREHFITDCTFFAEAEVKGLELYNNQADVYAVTRSKIKEIINEKKDDYPFFKAVVVDTFTNDDGVEKELQYAILACAKDINEANKTVEEYLKQGFDMNLKEIKETKILDVL